jgi:2-dehydro-3-deoxygluconokinase
MQDPPPALLTIGDPLVALTPKEPVTLDDTEDLALHVGGAELNTAVGVARLGLPVAWLGRVGADPLGRRVLRALRTEGVHTELTVVDPDAPTGLYLREWLPDGLRRPYYYRRGGAGTRLTTRDWPRPWPATVPAPSLVHVTGITAALAPTAADAVQAMVGWAGCPVSVDPNHRPSLWPDDQQARQRLGALVAVADVLLLSEDDARLLFGSTDVDAVAVAVSGLKAHTVVFKRGAAGAIAWRAGETVSVPAVPVTGEVDPVGAGDGFNAGFLAATMLGLDLADAVRCGAFCGARAVERVGENTGYPTLDELPADLRAALRRPIGVDR